MGLNATQWRNYILTQQVGQVLALLINIIFVTRVPNVWHSRQNGCLKRKKQFETQTCIIISFLYTTLRWLYSFRYFNYL